MQDVIILHLDGTTEHTTMDIPDPEPAPDPEPTANELMDILLGVENDG